MARLRPLVAIVLLVALVIGARAIGLQDRLSFATLTQQQTALEAFVTANPVAAPIAYVALYAAAVAVSLPVGMWLSIAGGLMFGLLPGTVYAVAGASLGAVAVFLLARTVAGGLLTRRAAGLLEPVRAMLARAGLTPSAHQAPPNWDGFSYLLALRLLPIVPFWIMNLAPALAGMRLLPYAAATVLGIIPATAVFVSLGAGLGDTLATGQRPDLAVLFGPHVLLPLLALAALALAPIVWRSWQRRRHA